MGDTQKSQTISTGNQWIAKKAACKSGWGFNDQAWGEPPLLVSESSLVRIKMLAKSDPEMVFIWLNRNWCDA